MFLKASKPSPCTTPLCISAFRSRKPSRSGRKLQYLPLCRRRTTRDGILKKEMEIKNLKLYMVNKSIIEENQKLRKKAFLLNQENEALLFQLQNNFSKLSAPSQHQPCTSQ